jgi:hypothetical protein
MITKIKRKIRVLLKNKNSNNSELSLIFATFLGLCNLVLLDGMKETVTLFTFMLLAHFSLTVPMEVDNSCQSTENLTFSTCNNDLPWPIEDFTSISVLITHGIHCVEILNHNDSSDFHRFHQEHCLGLMHEIDLFFRETPDYSVPVDICQDFRQITFPGGRIRRGFWSGWKSIRDKRETVPEMSQDLKYKTMATRNFELLLLKEKQGSELSQKEKAYLEGSRSPQTIRMAAMGIFCKYEGYIGVVKDLIDKHH